MVAFLAIILFFSCNNKMEHVMKVSEYEKLPTLAVDDIYFVQTEYGKIVLSIRTPELQKRASENNSEIMEFPKGIVVVQYSDYPDTLTLIHADYAINYDGETTWEARGNVVAINKKNNEILNTEHLTWDTKSGTIFSEKKVQVKTSDDLIIGEGFKSDDQFNDWQIEKVTGVISFENDYIETPEQENDQTNIE